MVGKAQAQGASETSSVVASRLERLRLKLLDLTTHNRMLSYRHPAASCLRVVDELPEVLFKALLEGSQLSFEPVPEPSDREIAIWHAQLNRVPRAESMPVELKRPDAATWARHLGLNVQYDLPVESDSFQRLPKHGDDKIQVLHYRDDLDARLRKLRAAARTAVEESGANMLHMAFGFLEWREQASARAHQAPLFLLPVELERISGRAGRQVYKIYESGQEPQQNLSLIRKLEEFGLTLPQYREGQSIEAFLDEINRAIAHQSDWIVRRYVTLGLFEFGRFILYRDIDPALWPSTQPIGSHPLVRATLAGTVSGSGGIIGEPAGPPIVDQAQYQDLQLELVASADSSQCEALQQALVGRNLVVEGPPGTGKSQTITNLVAAALAQGKTVLFVAEKLAALEVVRRRLRELGLGDFCLELHSHKTRKAKLLEDLAARLKLAGNDRQDRQLQQKLAQLADRRERLADYIALVSQPAGTFSDYTVSDALLRAGQGRRKLADIVSRLDDEVSITGADALSWQDLSAAKQRLRRLAAAYQALNVEGPATNHPWAGVDAARILPQDSRRIAQLADRWAKAADGCLRLLERNCLSEGPIAELAASGAGSAQLDLLRSTVAAAEELMRQVEASTGLVLARDHAGAAQAITIIRLAALAPIEKLALRTAFLETADAAQWVRDCGANVRGLEEKRSSLRETFKEGAFESSTANLEECVAALREGGFFAAFGRRRRAASAEWRRLARPTSQKASRGTRLARMELLHNYVTEKRSLLADRRIAERLEPGAYEATWDFDGAIAVAEWSEQLHKAIAPSHAAALVRMDRGALTALGGLCNLPDLTRLEEVAKIQMADSETSFWSSLVRTLLPPFLVPSVPEVTDDSRWQRLRDAVRQISGAAEDLMKHEEVFVSATGLRRSTWFSSEPADLATIASRASFATANAARLRDWLDFEQQCRESDASPEEELARAATEGRIPVERLDLCFDFLVFDALARKAFGDFPRLQRFSGQSLDALRAEYRELDVQSMELRQDVIASRLLKRPVPGGKQSGLKSELTELALIRSETNKQRRHIPIRQLVARAGNALQAMKPCFMMGPLSVAQYIAPGALQFDLVIMDEASQMRPEEAVGALARGRQAVIVGDPKQLPPTSFFDRIAAKADDDEDLGVTLAEESQSILDLAANLFEHRMLKWHYRSRHEALIAFSNKEFYGNDLIVFPSPAGQSGRLGVGWRPIADGVSLNGVNAVEARVVASAAAEFLIAHPGRSLGIVAMNVKQAQRIEDELQALAQTDSLLADALTSAEDEDVSEPFFIKNLENVQGDERDVIFISMTYGPKTAQGPVPQNFGPINQETGWRRLNVLFTRAKERMEVFSSMRSDQIVPEEGGHRGPQALKRFLHYAATGRHTELPVRNGREPDSDFEHAVIEGLTDRGFRCVPQVGVANFFLDIGVRDKAAPGEFIAAIECDGASYHSQRSARDRDRLRQEILENLGWNVLRVWSTDWFRDPERELGRLVGQLQALMAARAERPLHSQVEGSPDTGSVTESGGALPDDLTGESPAPRQTTPAVVPRRGLSPEQARSQLIDLRERTIKLKYPDADPARGLLRKSMLDALLLKRPTDLQEFQSSIRLDLRQNTDSEQLKLFGEQVFAILSEIVT